MTKQVPSPGLPATGHAGSIRFGSIEAVPTATLLGHMRDPRIARHLPLLTGDWDEGAIASFLALKADYWDRDGLGHWAIWIDGTYAGWGGFQKEGADWDFGLVLVPRHFSRGREIADLAFAWLLAETSIRQVTCLLPESRSPRVLARFGARAAGTSEHAGCRFTRWFVRLD